MAPSEADRNLLFGVLALQMDFVTRDGLIAAMNAWVLEKGKPLALILVERGDLREDDFALLDPLVAKHIERHGGDPERSLESLSSVSWLRLHLPAVADPDLTVSLMRLGAARQGEDGADQTGSPSVGEASSAGQRFRILRPHASGGLGEVYVARDAELNREVALKQIKGGYADHADSRSRFLLEAEITGGLEHPGIVPVYGLGHYPDGRPFYAMRFIRGDSLKEAIDRFHHADQEPGRDPGERALALRQLLGRFVDVCNAVAYAHSRGVLHRDLKPGNVMLGPYGETLVVDWGLAKPVGRADATGPTAEGTLRPASSSGLAPTEMGSAIGTPAYMSPEQAAGRLDLLGPASDVYSLGAMLYNLLTGRAPFTDKDIGDVLRKVQAGDFPPPRRVNREVSPALEAVCQKAMAREPGARYASPKLLADDVEHWLGDEPVTAWREPFSTRARRWIGRHRTLVTGATAAVLVGLVGLAGVAAEQNRSNRDLKLAYNKVSEALAAETKARTEKEDALAESEKARQRAQAALTFLKDDVLATARPRDENGGLGTTVTVREAIDAAEPRIAEAFRDHPVTEAYVRESLGGTYFFLGDAAMAIRQYERARDLLLAQKGPNDPDTLGCLDNLALVYAESGRTAEAIRIQDDVLAQRQSALGPEHHDTLTTRNNLAGSYRLAGRLADAIRLYEETLRLYEAHLGPDDPETLTSRNNLAVAYDDMGRTKEAVELQEETLRLAEAKLGKNHPHTLTKRNNLAEAYLSAGRIGEALALHTETLEIRIATYGPDHPNTLMSRNNLARAYQQAGRIADAIKLLEETLRILQARSSPDHRLTIVSRINLGECYRLAGRVPEALAFHQETFKIADSKLGHDHPDTLISGGNLVNAYLATDRPGEAARLGEQLVTLMEKKLGREHPQTLACRHVLAAAYRDSGRLGDAIPLFEETFRLREQKLGSLHPETINSLDDLADAYRNAGRLDDAIPLFEETLRRSAKNPGRPPFDPNNTRENLALAYFSASRFAEAIPVLGAVLAEREKALGPEHSDTLTSRDHLALAHRLAGQLADAIRIHEGTLRLREKALGPEHVDTLNNRKNLVDCYAAAGRWDEAERLSRALLAIRRKLEKPDSPVLAAELAGLGSQLVQRAQWAAAEPLLRECLAIQEKVIPEDARRFNTMSQLGGALLGLGQYARAEPLIIAGYEGMKARQAEIPPQARPRLAEAADRIIRLYGAWNKPEQAAMWKARLGLADLPADVFASP